jgi:aspartate aminotransferase
VALVVTPMRPLSSPHPDTGHAPLGAAPLREAAASYWARRGLPTDAVPRPSWVSYAAQASLAGQAAHLVPGSSGVPDAGDLARTVAAARASGRPVRSVIVTLPDGWLDRLEQALADLTG